MNDNNNVYDKMLASGISRFRNSETGKKLGQYNTELKKKVGTYVNPICRGLDRYSRS